jgi:hypothetical protein
LLLGVLAHQLNEIVTYEDPPPADPRARHDTRPSLPHQRGRADFQQFAGFLQADSAHFSNSEWLSQKSTRSPYAIL